MAVGVMVVLFYVELPDGLQVRVPGVAMGKVRGVVLWEQGRVAAW